MAEVKSDLVFERTAWALWFPLTGGKIGAFFSIAVGIRDLAVLPDLHWIDNSADAVLRVVIGALAAGVLVTLVEVRAFKLTIGDVILGLLTDVGHRARAEGGRGSVRLRDCLCDHAVQPGEGTSDSDRPAATGEVAAPRVPVGAANP